MQFDWSRVFSITTQELDFSQPSRFYRISMVVYHIKPKSHIEGPNLSLLPVFFRALRTCLTKHKENYMIKL